MNLEQFGSTDLMVSPLGLGLAALGRPGYITLNHAADLNRNYDVSAMEAHAHSVLDAAWNAGIRYFDAARSYGRAEDFLGSWLRSRDITATDVTVGSKWGYTYTADWQVESNIQAIMVQWDDEAAAALADLVESPEAYWQTRKNLAWN
jgi:aryl-alcohol dehydrogenase-like predicted oxidoreductase